MRKEDEMSSDLVLRGKTLIDGSGAPPLDNPLIIIRDGRIVEVRRSRQANVPQDLPLVDVGDCVLMPGLIDAHLHLAAPNRHDYRNTDVAHIIRAPGEMLLDAVKHARLVLEAGFTAVRDLDWIGPEGNICKEIVHLKEAIAAGKTPGPRIVNGGFTHTTNSHFDKIVPRNLPRRPEVIADGPWEMRRLVRRNLRDGADLIKTCISGGNTTFDPYENVHDIHISFEELSAMCDEAHAYRRLVAAHCHTPQSVRIALAAGVDTIEHTVFSDDETAAQLAASGKYCTPTLLVRERRVIEDRKARGTPEFVTRKMEEKAEHCFTTFRRYHKAGVKFAMGTDTGVDPGFGDGAREIGIYVNLGMSEMEAIQVATRNAADAIGRGADLGTVEVGKLADIIVVEGDPLKDPGVLADKEKIRLVIKDGVIAVDRR
jgi:imidazolonepropionase-like amidohydrolase